MLITSEITEEQALAKLNSSEAFTIDQVMKITQWPYNQAARQMEVWRRRSLIVSVDVPTKDTYRALSAEEIINL